MGRPPSSAEQTARRFCDAGSNQDSSCEAINIYSLLRDYRDGIGLPTLCHLKRSCRVETGLNVLRESTSTLYLSTCGLKFSRVSAQNRERQGARFTVDLF